MNARLRRLPDRFPDHPGADQAESPTKVSDQTDRDDRS
jgi:hypothetical protein